MKNKVLSILMAAVMSVSVGVGAGVITAVSNDATPAYAETAMSVTLTGDHYQGNSYETPYSFRLGDTAHFSAAVSGADGDVTYTYKIIPRSASSDFGTKTYSSADGKFDWTAERGGIYCVNVTASDSQGNKAYASLYYMVVDGDLSIYNFYTSGLKTSSKVGEEVTFYLQPLNTVGYPKCVYTIIDNTGVQAPTTVVQDNGYSSETFNWTPQVAGNYTIVGTVIDKTNQSATATINYTVTE